MWPVPATEVTVSSTFVSKELKSAATDMEATVTLGGDGWDQTYTATITGRSRQKWEPEPLSPDRVYVSQMTETDVAALLPGAAVRFAALMSDYLAAAPAASASPEPSPATAAPTETPAPATEAPEPATEAPVPATETPAPATEAPAPATEAPAPATEAPASVTEAPATATDTPAPGASEAPAA